MIFFLAFLLVSMLGVSGYIAQVLGWVSAISAFIGMIILAVLIYYATMWLTAGDEMVTGLFLFLSPACGLIIRFMVDQQERTG